MSNEKARAALKRLYQIAHEHVSTPEESLVDADYVRVSFALDSPHTESELYGMISTLTRERDEARSKPTDVVMAGRLRTIAQRLRELAGTPGDGSQYAEFYLDAVEAQMTMLRRNFKEMKIANPIPGTSRKREIEEALGWDPTELRRETWWQTIIGSARNLRAQLDEAKADYARLAAEYATRQNPSVEDLQRSLSQAQAKWDEALDQRDTARAELDIARAQRDIAQADAKSKGDYVNVLSQTVAGIDEMLTAVHGPSSVDLFTRVAQLSNQAVLDRKALQQVAEVTGATAAWEEAQGTIQELKGQIEYLQSVPDQGIVP